MRTLSSIAVAIVCVACGNRDGGPQGPFRMRNTPTKVTVQPLVADVAPISVALAPDASRYAYTTARGELLVRPLAGGTPKLWSTTGLGDPVALYVAGFFRDGSLGVLSTTAANKWQLHRVTDAGAATLLHEAPERLYAAISPIGDRVFVATATTISEVQPSGLRTITTAKQGDRILAIAISPDGMRIASMRHPQFDGSDQVHVTTLTGTELGWQQRFGSSPGYGNELLAWIDNERFVYAGGDSANEEMKTQVYAVAVTDGLPETRTVWPNGAYVGLGSAANGTLLVVGGTAKPRVLVGDVKGSRAPIANATRVIGWTADNQVAVTTGFWREEQILRGAEPWPGTKPGDSGVAITGDAVLLHRLEGNGYIVERLDPAGKRTRLAAVSLAEARWRPQLVRCAGEHAAPCVLEQAEYAQTSYTVIDPVTGKRGPLLHRHEIYLTSGPTPNAALSPDGKLLAVVEQSATITLVADGKPTAVTLEGVGAIDSIAFGANDELWIAAREVRGRASAVLRLALDRKTLQLRTDATLPDDGMRVYERVVPSRDRGQLAIGARELTTEIVRVDGL